MKYLIKRRATPFITKCINAKNTWTTSAMSKHHFPYKYVPVYEPNPTPICLSCPISAGFKSTQNSLNPQNKILALNLLCGQLNVWRLKTHLFLTHSTAVNLIQTKCNTKLFPSMGIVKNLKERQNYQSINMSIVQVSSPCCRV